MRKLVTLALVAVFAACSSDSEAGNAGVLTDRTSYPIESYGLTAGSILAPLTFQNPDGSVFSLDADVFKDSHNRVLLITTTAGWCGACKEEQPKLVALYKQYADAGLEMVSALFEDDNGDPATGAQAAAWKDRYKLPFPVVTDQPFVLSNYYDETLTPLNMVVDVDTMEILLLTTGYDETAIRSVVEANLDM